MTNEKNKTVPKKVRLPIKFRISDTIITRFASNMLVQTIENEFKLSFFEIKPEIRLAPSKDIPTEVLADCVASVIITVDKMPVFINALQTHLVAFNKSKETKEKT